MKSFKQFTEHTSPAGKDCPPGRMVMVMEMATAMGPITVMEVVMAMVAPVILLAVTVGVAMVVEVLPKDGS